MLATKKKAWWRAGWGTVGKRAVARRVALQGGGEGSGPPGGAAGRRGWRGGGEGSGPPGGSTGRRVRGERER